MQVPCPVSEESSVALFASVSRFCRAQSPDPNPKLCAKFIILDLLPGSSFHATYCLQKVLRVCSDYGASSSSGLGSTPTGRRALSLYGRVTEHPEVDDSDVLFHVKQWQRVDDEIHADLSRRFTNRRLCKAIDLDMPDVRSRRARCAGQCRVQRSRFYRVSK